MNRKMKPRKTERKLIQLLLSTKLKMSWRKPLKIKLRMVSHQMSSLKMNAAIAAVDADVVAMMITIKSESRWWSDKKINTTQVNRQIYQAGNAQYHENAY